VAADGLAVLPPHLKRFEAPVVDDAAGLVWAVNLTTIEFHPFLGTTEHLDAPLVL
jgi:DNA primase